MVHTRNNDNILSGSRTKLSAVTEKFDIYIRYSSTIICRISYVDLGLELDCEFCSLQDS